MSLRWMSIDFENRMIKVQNTDTFTTKTKKERNIPLNDDCYNALKDQRESRSEDIFVYRVFTKYSAASVQESMQNCVW